MNKQRAELEQEKLGLAVEYNEFKQISAIDQDSKYQVNKNLQSFNRSQDNTRKQEYQKSNQERLFFKDQFVNDMNLKKEIQYDRNIELKNNNVYKHMKEYQSYLNDSSPSFVKTINTKPAPYKSCNFNSEPWPEERGGLDRLPSRRNKSPQRDNKEKDDIYNRGIAEEKLFDRRLKQSNSQMFNKYNPLSQSVQIQSNAPIVGAVSSRGEISKFNPGGFYENFQSDSYKQYRTNTNVVESSLMAKLIVKMKALGIDGMINLFHQFTLKDITKSRAVEYYDFRGTLMSTYKIDFPIEDLKKYLIPRVGSSPKVNYKEFFYNLGQYSEERQEFISYLISVLDKNKVGLVDYTKDLMSKLNFQISVLSGKDKDEALFLKRSMESFYMLGYSFETINSADFHHFFCCFSILFANTGEFISSIKSIFGI